MNKVSSIKGIAVVCSIITLAFISCKPETIEEPLAPLTRKLVLPNSPFNYSNIVLPEHWDNLALNLFENVPSFNETTDEGATLGRVLFHDVNLSIDQTISCESCHQQASGFSDNHQFSTGIHGAQTVRNSMTITNLSYARRFFWDRRVSGLENQVLIPIEHPEEMGLSLNDMVNRVEASSDYPPLFAAAFGDAEVTSERVARALSQYIRSIYSYRSKYDEGLVIDFTNFTEEELTVKAVFFNGETNCNQCHMTDVFYSPSAMNNGLDLEYADNGVANQTGDPQDAGEFKVVTLRNLGFTAPYMHDGRFATLEEVVEHYNSGLAAHPNITDQLTVESQIGGTPLQMGLTEEEKTALIAFLHTLDDYELMSDVRYSNPFVWE
jgi:cytochrome c peroxidase